MQALPLLLLALTACAAPPTGAGPALDRIAFGSCAKQGREQPVWDVIAAHEPDLFLFLGDNVYADLDGVPEHADEIEAAYATLAARPTWQRFRAGTPVLATWDDHDYGKNDAGVEWALKRESQQALLRFFDEPADSPRHERDGVYGAWTFGPPGRRVQVLLLDTRFFRDSLTRRERDGNDGLGPYGPGPGDVLGEAQWRWLEEQLRVEADLRLVGSSIQFVAEEHHWECWANLPEARARMLRLIDATDANGVVFLSGDRHLMELSAYRDADAPYLLWDFTSSGLNQDARPVAEPNRHRVGRVLRTTNFGLLLIDWEARTLTLEGRDGDDGVLLSTTVALDVLAE